MGKRLRTPRSDGERLTKLLTSPRYIEGIVRGYRNGLLTGNNYSNMTQCENVDGTSYSPVFDLVGNTSC